MCEWINCHWIIFDYMHFQLLHQTPTPCFRLFNWYAKEHTHKKNSLQWHLCVYFCVHCIARKRFINDETGLCVKSNDSFLIDNAFSHTKIAFEFMPWHESTVVFFVCSIYFAAQCHFIITHSMETRVTWWMQTFEW